MKHRKISWALFVVAGMACVYGMVPAQAQENAMKGPKQIQGPAPPAAPTSRGLTLEYVVTFGMFGLALYVVCRSSGRN